MSNRRRQEHDPFKTPGGDPGDIHALDEAIYGQVAKADAGMQTAYPISIFQIIPDPIQPRRLLPGALRYDRAISDVLAAWWDMAEEEAGTKIAVGNMLKGYASERSADTDPQSERKLGPIEAGFIKLVDLAATIRRDGGLINPITIYRNGDGFRLETGERRWLAHHLLAAELGDPQWEKITAREVDVPSIWRQAHENTARDDLNAISLARQLALLIMDIYTEMGLDFQPYEMFQSDRHFYAQVAEGRDYPIPPGEAERIASAMGGKSASQIRQYRGLLRLPDHIWSEADARNTEEKPLRDMMKAIRITDQESIADVVAPASVQTLDTVTRVTPDSASTQDHEADSGSHPEPTEATPGTEEQESESLPADVQTLLFWAYQRVAKETSEARSWFSADNVGRSPERLNNLVEQGLLETRGGKIYTAYNAACYRISPKGCIAIGQEILDYSFGQTPNHLPPNADQPGFTGGRRPPVSAGEAHAGSGAQVGTPPRRRAQPLPLFQGVDRMAILAVLEMKDGRLDDVDGLDEAIRAVGFAVTVQQRMLDALKEKRAGLLTD